ncbi:hypothetical protein CCACVL1_03185 [Corchorus capsularis]|uniref:Uncharacterized protein n=1 Tax=Corchorus capsularis TaxID=210143 RepID=A0A1R3K1T4_COCAP|nr:hypothetical protein CCACVL1_06966 [Corchorus capsularis]OMP01049.1 hypothetical protein CCACVL1_03185 [Corchorus capsularis]
MAKDQLSSFKHGQFNKQNPRVE